MVESVHNTLGRMESKLDTLVDLHKDHEVRLRSLESSRSKLLGIAAGVSAAVSIAWKWLTKS